MSRFKTELCNNLIELGTCKYGDRCHYAHGAHELRQVSRRHPKYRTEKCKNFELTGKCPFGPRCSYVHPKPDLDSLIDQLNKYVHHTKAPKPDSDSEEESVGIFTRTATSSSLYSTCGSSSLSSNNIHNQLILDEANKENQLIIPYPFGSSSSSASSLASLNHDECQKQAALNKNNQENKFSYIDDPFELASSRRVTNTQTLQPLTLNKKNQIIQQQSLSSTNIPTQETQPRVAMRTISSNNQQPEVLSHNPSSISSPSLTTTPSKASNKTNLASNPFGIYNPLSDYLSNSNFTTTTTGANGSLAPNKQFYTRF